VFHQIKKPGIEQFIQQSLQRYHYGITHADAVSGEKQRKGHAFAVSQT
jgi:hypothetical protein